MSRATKSHNSSRGTQTNSSADGSKLFIGGVEVDFPYPVAYPPQLAVMNAMLRTLHHSKSANSVALVESPTGTGKTLALLTSVLAWQQHWGTTSQDNEAFLTRTDTTPGSVTPPHAPPSPPYKSEVSPILSSNTDPNPGAIVVKPNEEREAESDDDLMIIDPPQAPPSEKPLTVITRSEVSDDVVEEGGGGDNDGDDDFQDVKIRRLSRTTTAPSSSAGQRKRKRPMIIKQQQYDGCISDDEAAGDGDNYDYDDDDFAPVDIARRSQTLSRANVARVSLSATPMSPSLTAPPQAVPERKKQSKKPPLIFYATRTHAQVKKVVEELKKTRYRPTMSVLGSRENYCINEDLAGSNRKDAECKRLINADPPLCLYKGRADKVADHKSLRRRVWDIEDLATLGRKEQGCPYFASRALAKHRARIVFCPYNYLIDGSVREALGVSLEGVVVIMDEAHNIEDVCRDSASLELNWNLLDDLIGELERLSLYARTYRRGVEGGGRINGNEASSSAISVLASSLPPLIDLCTKLREWLQPRTEPGMLQPRTDQFEVFAGNWGADALRDLLNCLRVSTSTLEYYRGCWLGYIEFVTAATTPQAHVDSIANVNLLPSPCSDLMDGLLRLFNFLIVEESRFLPDYRLVIEKSPASSSITGDAKHKSHKNNDNGGTSDDWATRISFWCLSGAAAFRPFLTEARAVVLVSGTLSPFAALKAELGIKESSSLSPTASTHTQSSSISVVVSEPLLSPSPEVAGAPAAQSPVPNLSRVTTVSTGHVLANPSVQLRTICVARPPTTANNTPNIPLRLDYKSHDNTVMQDALGESLVSLCSVIPDGVLCFFPSYSAIDKLQHRWHATGLLQRLKKIKTIVIEPRGGSGGVSADLQNPVANTHAGGSDFNSRWRQYSQAVKRGKGAIFLAVSRGKVSEGMDFADKAARAVIIIGIPYPFVKDLKVALKRDFNNQRHQIDKNVLSGSEWYSLCAFRALNQSIGRVIRHRHDYGAILFLDERFEQVGYVNMLPNWVKQSMMPPTAATHSYGAGPNSVIGSLDSFFRAAAVTEGL
jgi:Fanconi anemia group J protein